RAPEESPSGSSFGRRVWSGPRLRKGCGSGWSKSPRSSCRSTPKQAGVLGLVPLACDIGAERRTADAVERHGKRSRGGRCDDRLESREHALTIGLAERDEPHAGRDETGGEAMQEGNNRRFNRNAVTR